LIPLSKFIPFSLLSLLPSFNLYFFPSSFASYALFLSSFLRLLCCFTPCSLFSGRCLKLTTDLCLVPRSTMVELYFHSPS
jgi:hypothetical protein